MPCPKFVDFTRECVKEIEFLPMDTYEYCTTVKFKDCPFYIILEKTGFVCENVSVCRAFKNFQLGDFGEFMKATKQYCLSQDYVNCKRYQLKKSCQNVPVDMHPDGRFIEKWKQDH